MARNLKEEKHYVCALILYRISTEMHKTLNLSPDDEVKWIRHRVVNISYAVKPLIKVGGRSRDIGIEYGLKYMEKLLIELRAVKNVDPDVRACNETECLNSIGCQYDEFGEYQRAIELKKEGIVILENHFGDDASKYQTYAHLLNNVGFSLEITRKYKDAKRYYVKAIDAYEKVLDFETENKKLEEIEITKRLLSFVRSEITKAEA